MMRQYNFDVVVCGGGTAGVAAAIGSAKTGARTLLLEKDPYCGGQATHANVTAFCGFYSCGANPIEVVRGVGKEILSEMEKLDPNAVETIISATGNKNIHFISDYLKIAMDNLLMKYNVTECLHTQMVQGYTAHSLLKSIDCIDGEGLFTVTAKSFVDATGDANLAYLSGAKTAWGNAKGKVQPATLAFRLANVDFAQNLSPADIESAVKKAKQAGIAGLTRERGFILRVKDSSICTVLLAAEQPGSLSGCELTRMEISGRRQVLSYLHAFQNFLPGMEHCELVEIGPSLGFRETRKMVGRKQITKENVLQRQVTMDSIARDGWKPEIHTSVMQMATYIDVPESSYFSIPLGALQSENIENLLGAGRIVWSDQVAFAAVRVMGTCFATGHAAGVAAAKQALEGYQDRSHIQEELQRQNALL